MISKAFLVVNFRERTLKVRTGHNFPYYGRRWWRLAKVLDRTQTFLFQRLLNMSRGWQTSPAKEENQRFLTISSISLTPCSHKYLPKQSCISCYKSKLKMKLVGNIAVRYHGFELLFPLCPRYFVQWVSLGVPLSLVPQYTTDVS